MGNTNWVLAAVVAGQCAFGWAQDQRGMEINPGYLLPSAERRFSIEYIGRVSDIPADVRRLRVWIPVPKDSSVQRIDKLECHPPARLTIEPKHGNRMAYWEMTPTGTEMEFRVSFVCARREARLDLARLESDGLERVEQTCDVFLKPDHLVIVDEPIRRLAEEVTADKAGTLAKTRAIYEYVLEKMTYDKNHSGWGLGSTKHACEAGMGNCTDFHALFNSLCRAQGIPSGFEIGLYLPYERGSAEPLGGYHCWALFRVPGKSWVPVDCSEGDRFPERREYFFGSHTPNRVTLSTGRDLILEPPQSGAPLNYFLNPHAEADSQPVPTEKSWTYQELE